MAVRRKTTGNHIKGVYSLPARWVVTTAVIFIFNLLIDRENDIMYLLVRSAFMGVVIGTVFYVIDRRGTASSPR